MTFAKVATDAFKNIQLNAGVVLSKFDPTTATIQDADIMGATSGGTNITATPSFIDFGEDIDNCPKNTKELKKLDSWEIKASGTFISVTDKTAKSLAALADSDSNDAGHITLRDEVKDIDFNDFWLVADYGEGGVIACHLMNALSTGGFQIQTGDKNKGQFAFEYTAHYSLKNQDKVPFEIYIKQDGTTFPQPLSSGKTKAVTA